MLDHLFAGCHVRGGVHGVNGAAFGVDVGKGWQCSIFKIAVEVVCSHETVHGVILYPFVLVGVDDVGFIVVLPSNVLVTE